MGPCIIVFPDCFTCLGGNQYINSSAIGNYADYLTRELIPHVDREFRTLASRAHRGCFGKSSGGYGAIIHGMKYAQHWGAIGDHSGDAYFDFCYLPDWPRTLNELDRFRKPPRRAGRQHLRRAAKRAPDGSDDGRVKRFLEAAWVKEKLNDAEAHTLMEVAMAASYDPDPKAPLGFRLPVDLDTGELIAEALGAMASSTIPSISSAATRGTCGRFPASTSIADRATSIISISARASCRGSSRPTASGIRTRSSTIRTRRSTTGWT